MRLLSLLGLVFLELICIDVSAQFQTVSKKAFDHLDYAEQVVDAVEYGKDVVEAVLNKKPIPLPPVGKATKAGGYLDLIKESLDAVGKYYETYSVPKPKTLTIDFVGLARIVDKSARRQQISLAVLEFQKLNDFIRDLEEASRNMKRTQLLFEGLEKRTTVLEELVLQLASKVLYTELEIEFAGAWQTFYTGINPAVRKIIDRCKQVQKDQAKVIEEQTRTQTSISNGLSAVLTAENADIIQCIKHWQTIFDTVNNFNGKLEVQAALVSKLEAGSAALQGTINNLRGQLNSLSNQLLSLKQPIRADSATFIEQSKQLTACCNNRERCGGDQHDLIWDDPTIRGVKHTCAVTGCLFGWYLDGVRAAGPTDAEYLNACSKVNLAYASFKEKYLKRNEIYNGISSTRSKLSYNEREYNRVTQELQKQQKTRDMMAEELKKALTKLWESSEFKLCQILSQGNTGDQFRVNMINF